MFKVGDFVKRVYHSSLDGDGNKIFYGVVVNNFIRHVDNHHLQEVLTIKWYMNKVSVFETYEHGLPVIDPPLGLIKSKSELHKVKIAFGENNVQV